jgi:hypothetical protein
MANPNLEVAVTVERAIHDALRALAQTVIDKHGLRICDVSFEWDVDRPIGCRPTFKVRKVTAHTASES